MFMGWRLIETLPPDDGVYDFWLDWADDVKPLNAGREPERRFRGKFRCWSSLYQATHWMPLLPSPAEGKGVE